MTDRNGFHHRPHNEASLDRKVGRLGMLIHRYYDAQAHRHGAMGDPLRGQGRVLALLAAKPTTTQRELSYLLDMRQQSLSELLAKLEEKGYITREKSAEDGRVTVVRLTEEGAAAAPSPEQMESHTDALDCLDDEERTQLEAITEKLTTSLEERLEAMGIDPYRPPRGHRPPHGPHRRPAPDGGRDPRELRHNGPHGPYRMGDGRDNHGMRQA